MKKQNKSVAIGMMSRVREKMSVAFRNAVMCTASGNEGRRLYWMKIAEKWTRKQTAINRRWPELLR